ncbi:MAG TPA: hypothetical protein VFJ28_13780 [Marmoricola sp.]|nr:hypothetical protein [Marmoricola sp.]
MGTDPTAAWITYDRPADGTAPFDLSDDRTLWVLRDGAGQWGRAWPAGDRRDFASWHTDFEQRVRMGYKVIYLVERLGLVAGGKVAEWQPSEAPRPNGMGGLLGTWRVAPGPGPVRAGPAPRPLPRPLRGTPGPRSSAARSTGTSGWSVATSS